MVSLKLIKANSDNCKSILFAIVLCVTVFIASLLYIDYSLHDMEREINEKYGKIDAVFYDTKGESDTYIRLINQEEVKNIAWQSNIPASLGSHSIILHILDFENHNLLNDIKNIDGKVIGNLDGICLGSDSLKLLGTGPDGFELTVNGITKQVNVADILDEKSFYETASTNQINVYISESYYTSTFGGEIAKNVFLVDLGKVSGSDVAQFAQKFDNLISHSIVDKIDLHKKESSQSFIYAVSFILIGLIGVVFGGLYNFSKTIISENIEHIGFLRTIGLSHQKAAVLYQNMVLLLGAIGEAVGVLLGILIGNLIIYSRYGFAGFILPKPIVLLASLVVSIAAPYVFMSMEIGKYKKHKPIRLLLLYRNQGYDESEDLINKYVTNSIFYFVLFIVLIIARNSVNDNLTMILSAIAVFAAVKAVESFVVVVLHMLSALSYIFMDTRPHLALSLKNLARNKKKTASVLGTLVLILAFHIGMYNVFYTIRTDAADKVELQYNGHVFITKYNQTQDVINEKINYISKLPIVKSVETSHSRFLTLEGSRIEGYILSESEFEEFFNLVDVKTGEKARLSDNKEGAIIGESLAKKGNIKVGDTLTISDNLNTYEITVEGICNAYEYMGNVVYLNEKYYSYPVNNITVIFKDGVDIDAGIETIKTALSDGVFTPNIKSREEIKESYRANAIKGTMFIEVILVFISTIGVFMLTNQVIQFINGRTREFALMRVMGTSLNEIMKINFAEFIMLAIAGIAGSVIAGLLVTWEFVDIASISAGIGKVASYHYNTSSILMISLYIFILYCLSLGLILRRLKNRTIIASIKEE